MTFREWQEFKQHFLTAVNIAAPNGQTQRAFVQLVWDLESDNLEPDFMAQRLVGTLYDGLAYGNWIPFKK